MEDGDWKRRGLGKSGVLRPGERLPQHWARKRELEYTEASKAEC